MGTEQLVNTLKTAIADNLWVVQVLAVLLTTLLINLLQKSVFNRLQRRFKKTKTLWDESLIAALRTPVALIIWIIGVLLSFRIIESNVKATGYRHCYCLYVVFASLNQAGTKELCAETEKTGDHY